ncbi:hypothetical protein CR513_63082, partial [Mucuna pruriens]
MLPNDHGNTLHGESQKKQSCSIYLRHFLKIKKWTKAHHRRTLGDKLLISTHNIMSVKDTPYDFLEPKKVGSQIHAPSWSI